MYRSEYLTHKIADTRHNITNNSNFLWPLARDTYNTFEMQLICFRRKKNNTNFTTQ
jgi:hypothetical protein